MEVGEAGMLEEEVAGVVGVLVVLKATQEVV